MSPSTLGHSTDPTPLDTNASRPNVLATSSRLAWRGLKAPKKLVVKRAKM